MHDRQIEDLAARFRSTRERVSALETTDDAVEQALMTPLEPERAAALLDRVLGPMAVTAPRAAVHRNRWLRGMAVASLSLAAAAAVLLVVRDDPEAPVVAVANVHAYSLEVIGALGETRGADDIPVFMPEDALLLRLRPQDEVRGRLTASVRAVHGDDVLALDWPVRITSASGHIEIDGAAGDLSKVARGVWALEVTVLDEGGKPLWHGQLRVRVAEQASP